MLRIYVKNPPAPVEIVPDYYPVGYGLLYNWYAATDAGEICADGWEVPTQAKIFTLLDYLADDSTAGGKLKETGLTYWGDGNIGATNVTNFNGRGHGRRHTDGVFGNLKGIGQIWTSTNYDPNARVLQLISTSAATVRHAAPDKNTGLAIRPLKTTTTLNHGQTGTYTGNDGKIYRTICIGTQEWLADNLAETKFRNGEYIPGFDGGVYTPISNATWAAVTTAMCCVYDDDLTNM